MTFTTVVIRALKKEFSGRHVFGERKSPTSGDWYEQFCSEVAWNEQYGHLFVRGFLKALHWYVKRMWRHVQSSN